MNHTVTLVLAKAVLGAGLVAGFATAPPGVAHAAPAGVDAYAHEVGDDNGTFSFHRARAGQRSCPRCHTK